MFGLFKKPIKPSGPQGSIPDGMRIYAIGDIHGRLDLLDTLMGQIDADDAARGPAESQIIFLGDLVDRGPHSAGVVERAYQITQAKPGTRLLTGNHEEVFLKALDGDDKALRLFCRIGGRETILSYGLSEDQYQQLDYDQLMVEIQRIVPQHHREFLGTFEDLIEIGDYAFVHAGISPDAPLSAQQPSDLRWIREGFLNHPLPFERIIVHGHTITAEIETRPNRIGIDTGAYASGKLSVLCLERGERWTIST